MKAFQLIAYLLLTVLLGACASQAQKDARASADDPSLASQYIYITERHAQQRFVTVRWVNPPESDDLKSKPEDGSN